MARTGGAGDRRIEGAVVHRAVAATEGTLRLLPGRDSPRRAAHARARSRIGACKHWKRAGTAVQRVPAARRRRAALPDDHDRRTAGQADAVRIREVPHFRRPCRAQGRVRRVLDDVQELPGLARVDADHPGDGRRFFCARAALRHFAAAGTVRGQHARARVPHAGRAGQCRSADAVPVPAASGSDCSASTTSSLTTTTTRRS